MKYLALVYLSKENWSACPDPVCFACGQSLIESGNLLAAEPLHPIETATTLRVRNGQFRSPMARLPKPKSSSRVFIYSTPKT